MGLCNNKLPVGYENFKKIREDGMFIVDKTMFIYDIINNGGQNNLFARPRRFGKTLNMSMLKYFFDIREKESQGIFDGLKISEHYDELEKYRNAYPTISLSLKSAKQTTYESALDSLCWEIQNQFSEYSFIADSGKLSEKKPDRV